MTATTWLWVSTTVIIAATIAWAFGKAFKAARAYRKEQQQ